MRPSAFNNLKFEVYRLSTNTINSLNEKLFIGGIDELLTIESQLTPEVPINRFYADGTTPPPAIILSCPEEEFNRLDFTGSYGEYFWEIFFHTPFLVADSLNFNQRFDEAKAWYQYIFDPTAASHPTDVHPNDRYWRFLPFRNLNLQTLVEILQNPAQIKVYNDDPFNPDAIARLRPSAYAKRSRA